MDIDGYRQLLVQRHTAESIDEVNVFLARAMESNLRLQKQDIWDRVYGYFGGATALIIGSSIVGGELLIPAYSLAGFLVLMGGRAVVYLRKVESHRKELETDHQSVKDYMYKATRDRLENGVAISIQNKRAAERVLGSNKDISRHEKEFLENSISFWNDRLEVLRHRIEIQNPDIWQDSSEIKDRLLKWIEEGKQEIQP